MIKISVIISFYNNIEWLRLVLAGFSRQSFKDFEVIISDDGSRTDVVTKIKQLIDKYPFPIQHVWHEDKGWRKNIILNKSIQAAKAEYLLFIDADCVPHKHFVKEHFNNQVNFTVLTGRRVNLSASITKNLNEKKIVGGYLECTGLIKSFFLKAFGKGSHVENGVYVSSKLIRKKINNSDRGILGCNFSMHKSDLLAVNGFDERYLKPAVGEDTDLELRLRNNAMKVKTLKHLAIQYHLYHKTLLRDPSNLDILNDNKKNNVSYTPFGIRKTTTK